MTVKQNSLSQLILMRLHEVDNEPQNTTMKRACKGYKTI
jgi:hypothetical protein